MTDIRSKLLALDVNDKTEEKGKFTYLSWAWAVTKMIEICPSATWKYIKDAEGNYSHKDHTGYFVETSVTVGEQTINEVMPVLDNRNKPIAEPNAFDVNTSLKRCLTKNFAMFGLGLYIYAGEDLPDAPEQHEPISHKKAEELICKLAEVDGDEPKFLQFLGCSNFFDLTESQYQKGLKAIKAKKESNE